jgi:hypothetical protein
VSDVRLACSDSACMPCLFANPRAHTRPTFISVLTIRSYGYTCCECSQTSFEQGGKYTHELCEGVWCTAMPTDKHDVRFLNTSCHPCDPAGAGIELGVTRLRDGATVTSIKAGVPGGTLYRLEYNVTITAAAATPAVTQAAASAAAAAAAPAAVASAPPPLSRRAASSVPEDFGNTGMGSVVWCFLPKDCKCSTADRAECARCGIDSKCPTCGMCTNKKCGDWLLCTLTKSMGVTSTKSNTAYSFRATISETRHKPVHPNIKLELNTELFKTDKGDDNVPVAAGSWILVVEAPAPATT